MIPARRGGESRRLMAASTWTILAAALAAAFLLELLLGSVRIPLGAVIRMALGRAERESWRTIILYFRLPRAVTACLAGAALAVSGLQMQTLFRNPLAGPTILGIGSGASLGVAVVVFASSATDAALFLQGLGVGGEVAMVFAAGIGSALVLMLVLAVSRRVKSVITLLILGLLFGYAVSGVVSILMHFAIAERIQTYISWTFGSFGGTTWRQLRIFVPVVGISVGVAQFARKPLNGLLLGESYARSMGVRIRRSRTLLIVTTALMDGVTMKPLFSSPKFRYLAVVRSIAFAGLSSAG